MPVAPKTVEFPQLQVACLSLRSRSGLSRRDSRWSDPVHQQSSGHSSCATKTVTYKANHFVFTCKTRSPHALSTRTVYSRGVQYGTMGSFPVVQDRCALEKVSSNSLLFATPQTLFAITTCWTVSSTASAWCGQTCGKRARLTVIIAYAGNSTLYLSSSSLVCRIVSFILSLLLRQQRAVNVSVSLKPTIGKKTIPCEL